MAEMTSQFREPGPTRRLAADGAVGGQQLGEEAGSRSSGAGTASWEEAGRAGDHSSDWRGRSPDHSAYRHRSSAAHRRTLRPAPAAGRSC